MPLRLHCPHCAHLLTLAEPYPSPGDHLTCSSCARPMAVAYPSGTWERLKARGKRFAQSAESTAASPADTASFGAPRPVHRRPHEPGPGGDDAPAAAGPQDAPAAPRRSLLDPPRAAAPPSPARSPAAAPPADAVGRPRPGESSPPTSSAPDAPAARPARPPSSPRPTEAPTDSSRPPPAPAPPPTTAQGPPALADRPAPAAPRRLPQPQTPIPVAPTPEAAQAAPRPPPRAPQPAREWVSDGAPPPPPRRLRSWLLRFALALALILPLTAAGVYSWYAAELPDVDTLKAYRPATVTVVYAADGTTVLGEIYEERRYVLPLSEIPKHVQDAFIAAEDASFWDHGGIDFMGILRAMGRNLKAGRVAQGGSTITQQVAKKFLLTDDRSIERKIKEAILSWRIESAYDKEHILYLYLNEIFLGSQAYGVEAAARTFFGKHVHELSVAEAAVIAGLPPRPSEYNPHSRIEAALNRQKYVIDQMLRGGYLTEAQAEAARNEPIHVVPRSNTFREVAPHFTEHARRWLVDTFGEDRVLHEGLHVYTTADPVLQLHAQEVVTKGARRMDWELGFRRDAIGRAESSADRDRVSAEHEEAMRKAWVAARDPTGRTPLPERSILEQEAIYDAVVTEVRRSWARVRVGSHEGLIPMAWSDWVYPPDPERSWKWRAQDDFTRRVDDDGDGKLDGGILRVGDVVKVRVRHASTLDKSVAAAFKGTPGEKSELAAVELWQVPDLESALWSMDLATGAVRAMVGGTDFQRSQLNRTTQAYRQVGSTFKPIVYAAGIEARKLTAATKLLDAEIAIVNQLTDEVWKPKNYDGKFLGSITLRRALSLSRNICTIRAVEIFDPKMSKGIVYDFARRAGIGGPPMHKLPPGYVATPTNDHFCPWVKEQAKTARYCVDRYPPLAAGVTLDQHKKALLGGAEHLCRECDLSLALGSASLTMEELSRAYALFPNGGLWREPYYVEKVVDRDGNVIHQHAPAADVRILQPEVATIMNWLLEDVTVSGTAAPARAQLAMHMAGKTGTTSDEKDMWFVGYTPGVITTVWVGYDQPRSLGQSSTGGAIALPIWVDYMRVASPKEKDTEFPEFGEVQWATIDEGSGQRTEGWGRLYPFLEGTVPALRVALPDEPSLEDLATEL